VFFPAKAPASTLNGTSDITKKLLRKTNGLQPVNDDSNTALICLNLCHLLNGNPYKRPTRFEDSIYLS